MSHPNPPEPPSPQQTTPPLDGLSDAELFDLATELTPEFLANLLAHMSFDDYCRLVMEIEPARHHMFLNKYLEKVESGEIKRLMIFMPPGSAKSTYASVGFPGWFIGKNPKKSIVCASHGKELAEGFSRKVRNWVGSNEYFDVFPLELSSDSKSVSRWQVEFTDLDGRVKRGAEYYAVGVESSVTGKRADGACLDDLVKGMKEAMSETVRNSTWEWYRSELRTRLKPNAFIILIMTRWSEDDIAGRILPETYDGNSGWYTARDGIEKWFVINLPALARENDILGRAVGEPLWPEWYTLKMLEAERAIQGNRIWNALYQQTPTADEGGILKKHWWRKWPTEQAPDCIAIIQSYDTAFGKDNLGDFSVRTTWGVFLAKSKTSEKILPSLILLEMMRDRLEYPALKADLIKSAQFYNPDAILIEDKASGQSLIQDLRKIQDIPPIRAIKVDGTDKVFRASVAAIVLEKGAVWYMDRDWAQVIIKECANFPNGSNDDCVDSAVQAWLYVRKRWWIQIPDDDSGDSHLAHDNMPKKGYYGHRAE